MFNNIFQSKKVLITGITGFKGSWQALWLTRLGAEVYGVSINDRKKDNLTLFKIRDKVKLFEADLTDRAKTAEIISNIKPDFIFHFAALPVVTQAYKEPAETVEVNILTTLSVLEAIRVLNYPVVAVFVTSDKVYENKEWYYGYRETDTLGGKDIYSASKACCELLISAYFRSYFAANPGIRVSTVRAGNVIGGGDWAVSRIIPDCMEAWVNNKPVILKNPKAYRPWQFVLESISGYMTVAQLLVENSAYNNESFNFGPGGDHIKSVEELVVALAGNFLDKPSGPMIDIRSDFSNDYEAKVLKLNIDKARQVLGWHPVMDFYESVEMTSAWYKTYYYNPADILNVTHSQLDHYCEMAQAQNQKWIK